MKKWDTRTWTIALLVVGALGYGVWDIVVAWNKIPGDTISEVSLTLFWRHPGVAFLSGYIFGHLLWPMKTQWIKSKAHRFAILLGFCGLAIGMDTVAHVHNLHILPILPAAAGIVLGHFFWPQSVRP